MTLLRPRDNRPEPAPAPLARHGRLRKAGPWRSVLGLVAAALAVVVVSAASVGGIAIAQLSANIDTFELSPNETPGPPPTIGAYKGGFNILIVGSDRCEIPTGCPGRDAELNDVNMILHVSEDGTHAVAVSIPRDLVIRIPSCPREDGKGSYSAMSAQPINVTLSYGGVPCTVATVEELTGLDIQFAGKVSFSGVIGMSNAVGGVDVCLTGPLVDDHVGLDLPAGVNTLQGWEALAFLRSRHGVGNGSDVTRISSQQVFLASLVRTLQSPETLGNPLKVYALAQAATSSMELSSNFASVDTLASMAILLRDIPLENITFVQYPGDMYAGGIYTNKVKPDTVAADELFAAIKADRPFVLAQVGDGEGSILDPAAPAPEAGAPDPGTGQLVIDAPGQTAADQTCTVTQ